MSMVYSPSIAGGHSLEAWGERLRFPKGEFSDWSKLSPEMVSYCRRDTRLCGEVYKALRKKMLSYGQSERGLEIEHKAWWIIEKQKKNGFFFNKPEAEKLYIELRNIEDELKRTIYHYWPPSLDKVAEYRRAFKQDGSPSKQFERHQQAFPRVELRPDGGYDAYDYVEFDLGSPQQRIRKLLELGWQPREPTKSGNSWKVTEKGELVPSLEEFLVENPETPAKALAEWISINARSTMINTWLEAYNERTSCIHGNLFIASTLRYKHSGPNTANIPGVRLDENDHPLKGREGGFRFEARNCWQTRDPKTRTLVGVDAKGIQLRILANYIENEAFTQNILSKDPHEANKKAFGLPSRSLTKTVTYATLMGAGDAKIASTAKVSLKEAKATKALFFEKLPGLADLIDRLQKEVKRTGRVTLCDGSKILVSSAHMVIPYLLQGDESRIMKQAKIIVDKEIRKHGLDALWVGEIHDEWQVDVLNDHVEKFIGIAMNAFNEAGKMFKYNLPIDGDAKVGLTWGLTH